LANQSMVAKCTFIDWLDAKTWRLMTLVFKRHRSKGARYKFQLHRARAGLSEFFQEDHLSTLVRVACFRWHRSSDARDRVRMDAVPGYLAPTSRALTNPLGSLPQTALLGARESTRAQSTAALPRLWRVTGGGIKNWSSLDLLGSKVHLRIAATLSRLIERRWKTVLGALESLPTQSSQVQMLLCCVYLSEARISVALCTKRGS